MVTFTTMSLLMSGLLTTTSTAFADAITAQLETTATADMAALGGASVDANYAHEADALSVSRHGRLITLVTGMIGMFASVETLALMGEVVERPGITFAKQDNGLTGLIDNRILVGITASRPDVAMPIVERIDFAALAAFDSGS